MTLIRLADRFATTPDDLHKRASELLQDSHQAVFASLPSIIGKIISTKAWKARHKPFKTFGQYALDQSVDGLCIDNDQKLWLLRCSMDVHEKHMEEWGDVLEEVERVVKVLAANEKRTIRSFNGNSLETLAKACAVQHTKTISYLPSRTAGGNDTIDGHLIRIRRADPSVYRDVVRGRLSITEGRQAAGLKVQKVTNVGRAVSAVKRMTDSELAEFIQWLKNEGKM